MPLDLRSPEWVALAFFLYLAAAAFLMRPPADRKRRVIARALLIAAFILAMAVPSGDVAARARDWLPLVYLLLGYWLPAHLIECTNPRLERMLLEFDRRLFGADGLARFANRAPRLVIELLELAYLFCYPVLPLGFIWLVLGGFPEEGDRFWTSVLLAGFCCYGLLPWLPTRAPRAIEETAPRGRSSIRALNLDILNRASVQLNTFPSGHTAASFAAALAVGAHLMSAGAVLGAIALGIAIGSVVGRYHYAADAITGAAVALAAFALSAVLI
jgi:membrane-associated phospholipid phosphatase